MKIEILKKIVVVATPALATLNVATAVPALPEMARFYGSGESGEWLAQLVMTIPAIGYVIGSFGSGFLIRHFGAQRCLLISLLGFLLAGVACFAVSAFPLLAAGRAAVGISAGVMSVVATLITGDYAETKRDKLIGYSNGLGNAVSMGAIIVAGIVVDHAGWQAQFLLYLVALPVVICAILNRDSSQESSSPRETQFVNALGLWPVYALTVALTVGIFMGPMQWPFLLEEKGVTSASAQGLIISVLAGVSALFAWAYGHLRRWISLRTIFGLTFASLGLGLAFMPYANSMPEFLAISAVAGIGAGLTGPAATSQLFDTTQELERDSAMGLLLGSMFLGQFINPLLVNPLKHAVGLANSFLLMGILFLLIGAYFVSVKSALVRLQGCVNPL